MEQENKGKNNKGRIVLLILIITIIIIVGILLMTETISFKSDKDKSNDTNGNKNNKKEDIVQLIQSERVDDLICNNSETTYDGVTIKLEQAEEDGVCLLKNLTINNKDIKNDVEQWIQSYEIYDKNVIIMSGSTSGRLFTIYNTVTNSIVMKLEPDTLDGYWVTSYIANGNTIIITGKECGEQCGTGSTGKEIATYEIEYSQGKFSDPVLVDNLEELEETNE